MALTSRLNSWSGDVEPRELSRQLRTGKSKELRRRRQAAALGLVALGSMAAISLFQLGIIDHLPEPEVGGLDADKVDASDEAYAKLNTPDAVLGLQSYAATMTLIAMGGQDRARTAPWIPLTLFAKATVDAVQAGKLTWDQWAKHKAFCSYCLVAAAATFATLPLVIPEARTALREVMDG